MLKINLDNGRLILNEIKFPESHIDNSNETYSHKSITENISGRKCKLTAYFKNQTLYQIHIHLDQTSLNEEFKKIENELKKSAIKPPKTGEIILLFLIKKLKLRFLKIFLPKAIPEKNYTAEYVDYCKQETESIIGFLLNTNKRNYDWGKIKTQVDPRGPHVFTEIRYYKNAIKKWQ